ncbi:non-ribosomal peptide synthetase [Mucilaginibacter lappiensis]|uniref:non-ribosomal peptide synthetase n=1 Tax=Mucilaginibacter lappiensis TaxID=354630 RepID=UPI0029500310|nr:non-ribosomal peptide synthetase [Mucilaginibacter lappiensis]
MSVYQDVLKRSLVGIKDDFFALGGDSIKSIQIVSRLKQRGYSLSIQDILLHPILEELASRINKVNRLIEQTNVEGIIPLSPIQSYFFESYPVNNHHYNQSVLLESKEPISREGIIGALDKIILHHDVLRMVYYKGDSGMIIQENKSIEQGYSFEVIECGEDALFFSQACDRIQSNIDLQNGPLFKVALFPGESRDRLLLVSHHLVIDGVSWRILFEDLSNLYSQYQQSVQLSLPLKTDSFSYWQKKQIEYSQSATLKKEDLYWSEIESSFIPTLSTDFVGSNLMKDTSSVSFLLDTELTEQLLRHCYKAWRTEINDILLSSLSLALKDVFGLEKILIKLEGHGREYIGSDIDITRTVGWFTTAYPVLFDLSEQKDKLLLLIGIKEHLHRIPNKGIGYGILRYLTESNYKLNPEITFNYLGDFGSGIGSENASDLFYFSSDSHGRSISEDLARGSILDISGIIVSGRLRLSIDYSRAQYKEDTIKSLLASYKSNLKEYIQLLSSTEQSYLTPIDITYNKLNVNSLLHVNEDGQIEDIYPLSPLQEGLYYYWLAYPGSSVSFEQMSYRLQGNLNIDVLKDSYDLLVSRHAILRTYFTQDLASIPLQVVNKAGRAKFEYLNKAKTVSTEVNRIRELDREAGFDLHVGSQMRLTVLELEDNIYEFIWSHHHILMDGWCVAILIREFFQIYHELINKREVKLAKAVPYSRYIDWLMKRDKSASMQYWRTLLSGYDTLTSLAKQNQPKPNQSVSNEANFVLQAQTVHQMKVFCSEIGITENTFIQTMWGLLLSKYNNTNDVVFGAIVSGRPAELEGVEDIIGLFINTIPVRIKFDPQQSILEILKQVQRNTIEGTNHHYTQLAEIQSESELGKKLFDHILIFENYPLQEIVKQGIMENEPKEQLTLLSTQGFERTNYDFSLSITPGNEYSFRITYDSELYSPDTFSRLERHYLKILEEVLVSPEFNVDKIDYVTDYDELQIKEIFNSTVENNKIDKSLVVLFEEQVEKTPLNEALITNNKSLSYQELNGYVNALAYYLREKYNVQSDDLIGIKLPRNEWMIIAVLSVLKAGGAYVPIDPDYPEERFKYIVKDSGCGLVIDETELDAFFNSGNYPNSNPERINKCSDLAYVIYTSGSTGEPKGVMVEHKSVTSFIGNFNRLNLSEGIRFGSTTNLTFDISVLEILGCLLKGLSLYLLDSANPEVIMDLIELGKIDAIQVTPSRLNQLLELENALNTLNKLQVLLVGGEVLSQQNYDKIKQLTYTRCFNLYGPTETTIWSAALNINESQKLSIGTPLSEEYIVILDKHSRLVPIGVEGEIYIGGSGLARGYLNKVELTKERFIEDLLTKGQKLYKTGDMGVWLEDGNISFIGRNDSQIKIRGYRIELGEIEVLLNANKDIDQVVVIDRLNRQQEREIIVYYRSERELTKLDLRNYLSLYLPTYILPDFFVKLDIFPLNFSGKIDRKGLPDPRDFDQLTDEIETEPINKVEEILLTIWKEVLDITVLSVVDHFFIIGGNSINLVRLNIQINKKFNIKLPLTTLLANLTIRALASCLETSGMVDANYWKDKRSTEEKEINTVNYISEFQLSYNQLEYFSKWKKIQGSVQLVSQFSELDLDVFGHAVNKLVYSHQSLRTVIVEQKGVVLQKIIPFEDFKFGPIINENVISSKQLKVLVECDMVKEFNLFESPLFRLSVYKLTGNSYIITLTMHHIIADGYSNGIIIKDLHDIYYNILNDIDQRSPILLSNYIDFVNWQHYFVNSPDGLDHKAYWSSKLHGFNHNLLLSDHYRTKSLDKVPGSIKITTNIQRSTFKQLEALCKRHELTVSNVMLGVLILLVSELNNELDITVNTLVSGRSSPLFKEFDFSNVLGLFANNLFVRNRIDRKISIEEFLKSVQYSFFEDLQYAQYPFVKLIEDLKISGDNAGLLDNSVFYNYHNYEYLKKQTSLTDIDIMEYSVENYAPINASIGLNIFELNEHMRVEFLYNQTLWCPEKALDVTRLYMSYIEEIMTNSHLSINRFYEKIISN